MYAIVEIAGQQFKVSKDQRLFVHRLANDVDAKVSFEKVLLIDNGGALTLGAPAIEGASVEAKVLQHLKGDKVIVFKKKRRKGYKKKNGHRQAFTQIIIENIVASGATKKEAAPKKEVAPKKEAAPKATKKAVVEVETVTEEVKPKATKAKKPKTEE
jgi:large subunit ribosomal protein L21